MTSGSNTILNLKTLLQNHPSFYTPTLLAQHCGGGHWMYVGRGNQRYSLPNSPLANPYSPMAHANAILVATRTAAIEAYRQWLWERIRTQDRAVLAALSTIKPDTTLVCWCAPQPCHAQVVAAAAAWLRSTALLTSPAVKVVVCGGRDFADYTLLEAALGGLLPPLGQVMIISGAAQGADTLGERYARDHALPCQRFPAQWKRYGRRAGFMRNQQMAAVADVVIAFWDGRSRGTKAMIDLALAKGIPVHVIRYIPL